MLKIIKEFGRIIGVLSVGAVVSLSVAASPLSIFEPVDTWEVAESVDLDGARLLPAGDGDEKSVLLVRDRAEPQPLISSVDFGDSVIEMEVLLTPESLAGIFLQGRYEIVLAPTVSGEVQNVEHMGALAHRRDEHAEQSLIDGVPPSHAIEQADGQWYKLHIRFRAPRYNDAGQKVESAMFLEVRINDTVVQRNTLAPGFTQGAINPWETPSGPLMIKVHEGPFAIRNVRLAHADFNALEIPTESGGDSNEPELQDFVQLGEKSFRSLGCASCHAVNDGETSVRAGSNLFGLFQRSARDRLVEEKDSETRFTLKADRSYLHSSVRTPDAELAVAEEGANEGQAYQAIMPAYSTDTLSDNDLDAIGAYLKTLNPLSTQGPVTHLVEEGGPENYDPLTDGLQRLVLNETQLQRGPMTGTSARAIHVGLPNGINYSFDPRVLGVVKLWQGGFLDMSGELRNRGGGGLNMGHNSREIDMNSTPLFAPLLPNGEAVDFSFKESVFQDYDRVQEALYAKQDHFEQLGAVDARFLGYSRDSERRTEAPRFLMKVGDNRLDVAVDIAADGRVSLSVGGTLNEPQRMQVADALLKGISVSVGKIEDGQWLLPKDADLPARLSASIDVSSDPWRPEDKQFDYERQPLKVVSSEASLLAGYTIEDYLPPKDNYGRDLLFEALGLAVAEDGTVVVATRNAGIWRIVDGEWHLFAEGLFDSLGVVIEDKKGLDLVVGQKAELTRIRDTNGDGRADRFETLFDGFGYHGNYHTYLHGPVKGADGAYYFGLNLAHTDDAVYKADGLYMGSQGGFSGWAFRVTPDGEVTPWASGLRSAAGWTRGPDDKIWITENQGEFVGTSKLFVLEKDAFFGHPSSLVDLPGMTPDSADIAWEKVQGEREQERLLMPQNLLANSPGHPVWDTTKGKFGPFVGQMLIGDQTQSNLFRVALETLPDGTVQGAALPFAKDLASGAMRPVFLPDGSLLIGQTGRGWQAKGGHVASLQRIRWQGEQAPMAIETMTVTDSGFKVRFTRPLPNSITSDGMADALALSSWTYRDAPDYGSERLGLREESVRRLTLDDSRREMELELADLTIPEVHPQQTARVYHLVLDSQALSVDHADVPMSVFYTLHSFRPQ